MASVFKDMIGVNKIPSNPAIGLSDAIVGTYGPVRHPDFDNDVDIPPEFGLPPSVNNERGPSACCCCCGIGPIVGPGPGAGAGVLIEENEIVL